MAQLTDEEEFNYASLVNRWRRERANTALTRMEEDFYEAFDRHLRRLHEDYQREQAVNPATAKVLILLDELTNLQRVRDDLYDLRERKVVTAAIIAAREGRIDHQNMTRVEKALFDTLLRTLREARRDLLRAAAPEPAKPAGGPPAPPEPAGAVLAARLGLDDPGSAPPMPHAQPAAPLAERARAAEAAPEQPLPGAPPAAPPRAAPPAEEVAPEPERRVGPSRVLVRVRSDVEPFVAPDLRHYRLMSEDVAALPREVAHLLIGRGLATALGG